MMDREDIMRANWSAERETYQRVTCAEFQHIPAGERIWNGYSNGYCTAPETGQYTLYELVDDNNCHKGWEWEKEDEI